MLYSEPVPGIPIVEASTPPTRDEVLLGYEIVEVEKGLFVRPRPRRMTVAGWLLFGVTLIFTGPLALFACCLPSSYSTCQRPVYGVNGSG